MLLINAETQSTQRKTQWNSLVLLPLNHNKAFLHEGYQAQPIIFLPVCVYVKLLYCFENNYLRDMLAFMLIYCTKGLSIRIASLMLQNTP